MRRTSSGHSCQERADRTSSGRRTLVGFGDTIRNSPCQLLGAEPFIGPCCSFTGRCRLGYLAPWRASGWSSGTASANGKTKVDAKYLASADSALPGPASQAKRRAAFTTVDGTQTRSPATCWQESPCPSLAIMRNWRGAHGSLVFRPRWISRRRGAIQSGYLVHGKGSSMTVGGLARTKAEPQWPPCL